MDTNDIWRHLTESFSAHLLDVQRAETQAIEAEAARVRGESERVTQDKPMSRKGDRRAVEDVS